MPPAFSGFCSNSAFFRILEDFIKRYLQVPFLSGSWVFYNPVLYLQNFSNKLYPKCVPICENL